VHPETRQTPLHVAVDSNHMDVAELLILNGANVNAVNQPNMETPLHLVKSVEMAEVLVKSGASLAAQNAWFQTPLHCACKSGEAALVKLLISFGGTIDAKDQQGRTPLHYCCTGNRVAAAECLIESGCSISELDTEGFSALALADLMASQDVAGVIRRHQFSTSDHQPIFFQEKK
jgi:ankyrin repeat protein